MDETLTERLRLLLPGIVLGLVAFLFGFGLGGVFGAAEDAVKDHLDAEAMAVLDIAYGGDSVAAKQVTAKSWTYLKRAHLHAGSLGAAALVQILLLALLARPAALARVTALLLGIGAAFYPVYWMWAALCAPRAGGTDQAKESLQWLAIPSSGAMIAGTCLTLALVVHHLGRRR